jgi:Zn finger protein HypA/HybF involved in hydrogenase expression
MLSFKVVYTTQIINLPVENITIEKVQEHFNYPIDIVEAGTEQAENNNNVIHSFVNYNFIKNKLLKSFYIKKRGYVYNNCIICYENHMNVINCNQCSAFWCYNCNGRINQCPQCRVNLN